MRYKYATKLHNEDEVTLKKTNQTLTVLYTEVCNDTPKPAVLVTCNDGNTYHHTEIR